MSQRRARGANPMTVEYTGRQTEVTERIRVLTEKKLKKLTKVLPGITHVHIILTSDKHRQLAEVSVHSRHLDLTAIEETADVMASVGNAIEKIERQAQKHVGKWRERKRRDDETEKDTVTDRSKDTSDLTEPQA